MNLDQATLTYFGTFLIAVYGGMLFSFEWYKYGAATVFKCFTFLWWSIAISSLPAAYVRFIRTNIDTHAADQMLVSDWWAFRNLFFLVVLIVIAGIMTHRAVQRQHEIGSQSNGTPRPESDRS